MTDTTVPLHVGALYTYQPDWFDSTVLTEIVSVDANGIRCQNHLSSDATPVTQPMDVVLNPASFGITGEYTYAGDIRNHQGNPDVGDVFVFETEDDGYGGTRPLPDGPTAEIVERTHYAATLDRAIVLLTSRETGHRWTLNVKVSDVVRHGRWVGTTRPVFDTPERYAV